MVDMINTNINGRWNIKLPKHRSDRPEWKIENGGWERLRLNSMFQHIEKDKVMYYVGSEEGDMAGLCSMWGAELVLFEPNERVWPNIKSVWDANNLKKPIATFIGFASNITSPSAEMAIKYDFPKEADGEVISDHGFKELVSAGDVPQITIDKMAKTIWKMPDYISIDVEGSEWQVLRGAENTLKLYKPLIWLSIHPEFLYRIYNEYQRDLRDWILALGYKEEIIDYQHELHLLYTPL